MVCQEMTALIKTVKKISCKNDVSLGRTLSDNYARKSESLADNRIVRQEFNFSSSYPFDDEKHLSSLQEFGHAFAIYRGLILQILPELEARVLRIFTLPLTFLAISLKVRFLFKIRSQLIPHAFEHIKSIYGLLVSHNPFSAQLSFSTALKLLSRLCGADGTEKLKIRKMN
ncbi:hypothetical protein T4C_4482 [Trichinella pseudospiralis]|uniref:Uncharacterized protein n=1 Tax=Trichinella pseudospiralis TaxID=6337 RepID=A0A0V1K8L7_TRIPS|nr:hypothetical protein T4D_6035 [Trichinella pseudospiralis]KRZ43558.1 hypothetical protein T4C_4482 [Trichinella pseudospiralis]